MLIGDSSLPLQRIDHHSRRFLRRRLCGKPLLRGLDVIEAVFTLSYMYGVHVRRTCTAYTCMIV